MSITSKIKLIREKKAIDDCVGIASDYDLTFMTINNRQASVAPGLS